MLSCLAYRTSKGGWTLRSRWQAVGYSRRRLRLSVTSALGKHNDELRDRTQQTARRAAEAARESDRAVDKK